MAASISQPQRSAEFWRSTITSLERQRQDAEAAIADRRRRRDELALEASMGSDAARSERARLDRELNELSAGNEEATAALRQAEQMLRAAELAENAALEQERQARLRAIAKRCVQLAGDVDAQFRLVVDSIAAFKAEFTAMSGEEPALNASALWRNSPYTRAARVAGLGTHLDIAPAFMATHEQSLEAAAASDLEKWLLPPKEKKS